MTALFVLTFILLLTLAMEFTWQLDIENESYTVVCKTSYADPLVSRCHGVLSCICSHYRNAFSS